MNLSEGTNAVYDKTFPTARKPTRCEACEETTPVGKKYTRVGICFQGAWQTVKRCMRCERIHNHLAEVGAGDEWPDERLDCGHTYEDVHGAPPPDEIAALAFALPGEV